MKVHIKVIEAKNLPVVDVSGSCDGYCKIQFGKQKAQTRTIDNSLTPRWRQQFSFDVLDFQNDFLFIQLYDHDAVGKDDLISDLEIYPQQMEPGLIIDQWYTMNQIIKKTTPKIHLVIHLSQENDKPFEENPFQILVTNIRIISVNDVPLGEYTVSVGYKDNLMKETRKTNDLLWQEEFYLAMPTDEPVLKINLNKGKNIIANTKIPIGFEVEQIVKNWYALQPNGSIKLAIQVAPNHVKPFLNEKFEDFLPATELTVYFRIIEGKDLTPMDSNGKNDAYCTVSNLREPKKYKTTQILYKSVNPKWNYFVSIKVYDYQEDVIRISCYDYDKLSKDDLIGYKDLCVKNMGEGKLMDEWINIYNSDTGSKGFLHIMYQVCTVNWIPFKTISMIPLRKIHIHIMDGHDIPNVDLIGKTDPYLRLKLNDQEFVQKTDVKENTLNPLWDQTITLYSLSQTCSLQIELRDEATGKDPLLGSKNIDLSKIVDDDIVEYMEELIPAKGMKKGGIIHFYVQITNLTPFVKAEFTRYIDTGKKTKRGTGCADSLDPIPVVRLTLFVKISQAFNLTAVDSNGLSDPYCILKLNNQKKTTSVVSECLNPLWNEYFEFFVNSIYFDILYIDCMDKDKLSKDDLIGSVKIELRNLIMGKINELKLNLKDKDNKFSGSLLLSLHLANLGDIPFQEKLWNQKVLNIRILEGKNLPNGFLYWTGKLENEKENQFVSTQTKESKWIEEFQIQYSNQETFILKLIEHGKKEIEIGQIILPYTSFKYGAVKDEIFNIGKKGQIHLIFELNDLGYPKFSTLLPLNMNDKLFLCKTYMFNIQVIEAKDVPSMDRNGLSDPFIKLYLLGPKPKEKIGEVKTKIIKKSLTPVWNEEYHFPIKSLGTDVLHLSFKDWNKLGKDDPISTFDIEMSSLILGKVYDEWISFYPVKGVSKGGKIHLKYHLASPGTYAFVDNIKDRFSFHIQIIEAKDVKSMDLNGFSDPYCQMQIIGDRTFSRTSIKYETLSPYWDETFHFIITNYETDIFRLELRDKDKFSDDDIGEINLQLKQFEIGKVYKKWIEVQHKGKKTGLIRVVMNITKTGEIPFIGEIIEEKKNFISSDKWGINIHLMKANNLPSADSNGLSDPYCLFKILNTKTSVKSRRIDKCLNPKWDEYFHIPINSLNSDILRLEIIDWDKIGSDDKLCMKDFPLINYEFGKVYSDIYSLTPLEGRPSGSTVELSFQITPPSIIPFEQKLYIPDQLNIRLEDVSNIITKKPLKKPKLYFNLKLEKDSNEGLKSVAKEELNNELKEDFNFIITDQMKDRLVIEYKNEADKNKMISKCIIPLNELKPGTTEEIKKQMEPIGLIHLYLQINKKNEDPFQDTKLLSAGNPYMTLYIKVLAGRDIPVADDTGLSDPFCILELIDRKDERKTEIKKQTLNPVWNQEFQFKVLSYNTDIFRLSLYDYDKYSKNDLLGKWTKHINELKPGVVYDETIKAGGYIQIKYQLAVPNQPKWENTEKLPMILNIKAIEAKEFPNNAGKTDGFLELFFKDDLKKIRTTTLENTMTPQWFQEFKIFIIDINEPFYVKLWDENKLMKNSPLSQTILDLKNYQLNYVYNDWYDMIPLGSYEKGGKVRLEIQITEYDNKEAPFEGLKFSPPPLPISETSMLFNIKIIKGNNIQAMDNNGSSDPYCKLEFIGHPDIVKKTRIIEHSLKPFWDEFFQFEIKSLHDTFKISLWDYDKLSKDDAISYYTIDLSESEYGIIIKKDIKMIPADSSIYRPGDLSIIYQITRPGQQIFTNPEKFMVDKLTCYLESISDIPKGNEYYWIVKTIDSYKYQTSKVFWNGILMETFDILMRKDQQEILELILYQQELKGIYKFPREIKRIQYPIQTMGQQSIEGLKFTLSLNQPSSMFSPASPIIYPKRYFHIYVDCCQNLPSMDTNGLSDPFVKISLNKKDKERYVDRTRVVLRDLNPIFKQTFHIPIYSLRDDIISVEVYDYDKVTQCDLIGKIEFKASSVDYGIVRDDWYNIKSGKIHLITHLSDQNKPAFISESFVPLYLNVKVFEYEVKKFGAKNVVVHMKNDLFTKSYAVSPVNSGKIRQFSQAIFTVPITNIDENYVIEQIDPDLDSLISTNEFETKDLKEGYIYRNNINGIRFWTQILSDKNKTPFSDENFADYYNLPPDENYTLYVELKKMEGLPAADADGFSDPYFIAIYGDQIYKSRTIENNLNPTYYDEFKFTIKNLETNLCIKVMDKDIAKDDNIGTLLIDLTSEPFGHVVDKKYNMNKGSIYIKWQVTEPGQKRWSENIFKPNILNINIGKYEEEQKPEYEFWKVKLDYITKQTSITPCGVFNETFSFILTNQTQILFEQYKINSDNYPLLIQTIPINFIDLKNGPFKIMEGFTGLIEIVAYGTTPFIGQKLSIYYSPPSSISISVFVREAQIISKTNKFPDPYILFKFKDRKNFEAKSLIYTSTNNPIWNQYFNFEVLSISTDFLEIYVKDKTSGIFSDNTIGKIEIPIYRLLDGNIKKENYHLEKGGSIKIDTQLVFPDINPFTEYKTEYDNLYIKFLDGINLSFGDLYCRCKLSDDIDWKRTKTINKCKNPQWYQEIILPITNESNQLQIEIKDENIVADTSCGSFKLDISQITTQTKKYVSNLSQGKLIYLIQKGTNGLTPFTDYFELYEKILAENVMLAIKVVEAKNLKAADINTSDPYCLLKFNGIEKKTRVIDSNLNPIWNEYFYFNITSFETNELSIKIFDKDKLSKDDLLYDLTIPIKDLQYGIVEDKWYNSLHLITHIILPGNYSFEPNPFTTTKKTIFIEYLENKNNNIFCKLKLAGDEYWKYTKEGDFKDYFITEYINNYNLIMIASNGQNNSEVMSLDISKDEEKIYENNFGKFKISFPKEIKPTNSPCPFWTCNILIKNITNIKKEKETLWLVEINKYTSGYTYDGNINKYITLNVNSAQNDQFKVILYKSEKGKKSEYAKGEFSISEFELGITKEKIIILDKIKLIGDKYTDKKILINVHITPPNAEPFFNQRFYPLIMHIYALEAINIPKMDLMSKTDPYVVFRFEKDTIGTRTKYLEDTLTPQWNQLIDLIITDINEDLIIEIWDKNIKFDKMICSTKLNIKKYLNGEPEFLWIKIGKVSLNIAIHVKKEGEDFICFKEVEEYQANNMFPIE